MGDLDPGRFLRADRMEGMATMGIPTGGSGNELDCRLCDELDHVEVFRERLGSPRWKRGRRDSRTDDAACAPWVRSAADFLVHPVVDVPSQDLSEDLRQEPLLANEDFLKAGTYQNNFL